MACLHFGFTAQSKAIVVHQWSAVQWLTNPELEGVKTPSGAPSQTFRESCSGDYNPTSVPH